MENILILNMINEQDSVLENNLLTNIFIYKLCVIKPPDNWHSTTYRTVHHLH